MWDIVDWPKYKPISCSIYPSIWIILEVLLQLEELRLSLRWWNFCLWPTEKENWASYNVYWWLSETPISCCFLIWPGGWIGYFSYDTVRYVEKRKLPFSNAPYDDRSLPDVHLGLYDDVIVFDHVEKVSLWRSQLGALAVFPSLRWFSFEYTYKWRAAYLQKYCTFGILMSRIEVTAKTTIISCDF